MTNVVDAAIAYTNLVFQLMLSDASRVSKVLDLPLPNPIPAAAVSKWSVPAMASQIQGSLEVTNYHFEFNGGVLVKFRDVATAQLVKESSVGMDLPFFTSAKPLLAPLDPATAGALVRAEGIFKELGGDSHTFGEPQAWHADRVTPQIYGMRWDKPGERRGVALVEMLAPSQQVVGFELAVDLASKAFPRHLTVTNVPPRSEVQIVTNAVLCAAETPAAMARSAVAECFQELRNKVGVLPIKRLFVESNLGNLETVSAELEKIFPAAIYFSVPWENPPSSYPKEQNQRDAAGARGINMVAIIGDVDVSLVRASFLRAGPDFRFDRPSANEEIGKWTPLANSLVDALDLRGPGMAHWVGILPGDCLSSAGTHAFHAASSGRSMMTIRLGGEQPISQWVSIINREMHTNEPVAFAVHGNFTTTFDGPHSFKREVVRQSLFEPLEEMFVFRDNPSLRIFKTVGETGFHVLEEANTVEIFRLWQNEERRQQKRTGPEIDGYVIRSKGPKISSAFKTTLREIMLHDSPLPGVGTGCIYDPGIAFRVTSSSGSVTVLVCFGCMDFKWNVRDSNGKVLTGGSLRPDEKTMKSLRKVSLNAFPHFRELKEDD